MCFSNAGISSINYTQSKPPSAKDFRIKSNFDEKWLQFPKRWTNVLKHEKTVSQFFSFNKIFMFLELRDFSKLNKFSKFSFAPILRKFLVYLRFRRILRNRKKNSIHFLYNSFWSRREQNRRKHFFLCSKIFMTYIQFC